ncbi:DUF4126 family protein [Nitrosomonas supralitoralis]|uniref:Short C-terminal domain-containing protein n=1 Tax=Nitrosomonas supralitoralis TaxID=2116706 RepID=A0A2P7NRZ7_9PROT|nr:DUF4126 family protein [Nitrosomonas supralitoralis]PSJ16219.1 hypothetical protein C7H79_14640 [Nitrosomonas supralitoralis]
MENYETLLATVALMMGASWASGINLYAVLLVLGLGGSTGHIDLPAELSVLQEPLVIGAAGIMYFIEFFMDKIPGMDSVWDSIHTFVRIPAGAMLAAGAVGDVTPALEIAAGILGGGMAATSHATKAGTRLLINTSPEPVTNWSASIMEDFLVLTGMWAALKHPEIFLIFFVLFMGFAIWSLPKLWYLIKTLLSKIAKFLSFTKEQAEATNWLNSMNSSMESQHQDQIPALERLQQLRDKGVLTAQEFEEQKSILLKKNNMEAS